MGIHHAGMRKPGHGGDRFEHEANRVAKQLLPSPGGKLGRRDERHDPSPSSSSAAVGRPLCEGLRGRLEAHFGHDFSRVRVHADAQAAESARELTARAYTLGNDIVFGEGEYQPETSAGKQLLAHELTHVVQQNGAGTGVVADGLGISHVAGRRVQLAPAGVTFSLNIEQFEAKVRRAIASLAQVRSQAEESTFVFYSVPILSQIAVSGFGYIDNNGTRHPGSILDFTFPTGRFSLSLVLDDRPAPASGEVEEGYFQASGNSGEIGLRLQSDLAQASDEQVASVLYHETIHLYSHLLRTGLWFRSSQTGHELTPAVKSGLELERYAAHIDRVEAQINSFLPVVNQARQQRGVTAVTSDQVGNFARALVEEAMVRAETFYFTAVRSTGPGTRGLEQEMAVSGGGSFLNTYLFQFEDMLTPADATALSGNADAQEALRMIQANLDLVYEDHFRLRWGPVGMTQELSERTPSLAPGFQP